MLRPGQLRQDGVCLASVHNLHQRATVHAEGDRECRGLPRVALQLSLFDAAAAPPDLLHRQEAAGGLVDVHDAVCADAIGAHKPAQLDEERWRTAAQCCGALSSTWRASRSTGACHASVASPR